jgi:G:T-mismatch repair DNA endonuclease (very short patch repair protein)
MKAAATRRASESYVGSRNPNPRLLSLRRREEWARRTPEEKERHLTAFIAAGQRTNKKSRGTRIEVQVSEILDALGLEYCQNVQIGRFNVDFIVGDAIIECFGDFWHCNPATWTPDRYNGSLHMLAQDKWARDAARQRALEQKGFRFVALWESDIRSDPGTVESVLRELLIHRHGDVSETE